MKGATSRTKYQDQISWFNQQLQKKVIIISILFFYRVPDPLLKAPAPDPARAHLEVPLEQSV